MSELNRQRTNQTLERLYGKQPKEMKTVRHSDGSVEIVPSHSRTLEGQETNRYWQELADKEERQRAEAQASAEREQAQVELSVYKESSLQKWQQAGGTTSDFDLAWPELRRKYLLQKTGLADGE